MKNNHYLLDHGGDGIYINLIKGEKMNVQNFLKRQEKVKAVQFLNGNIDPLIELLGRDRVLKTDLPHKVILDSTWIVNDLSWVVLTENNIIMYYTPETFDNLYINDTVS